MKWGLLRSKSASRRRCRCDHNRAIAYGRVRLGHSSRCDAEACCRAWSGTRSTVSPLGSTRAQPTWAYKFAHTSRQHMLAVVRCSLSIAKTREEGRMKKCAFPVLICLVISGCTNGVELPPTIVSSAEIIVDSRLPYPVSIYIDPELESLSRVVRSPFVCPWLKFPVFVGDAVDSTLRDANKQIFSQILDGGSYNQSADGAKRHIAFHLEFFDPRLEFINVAGYRTTGVANFSILIGVTVYDENSEMLFRTIVEGEGSQEMERVSDCDLGTQLIQSAAQTAIRQAVEDYVRKVVNSNRIHQPLATDD